MKRISLICIGIMLTSFVAAADAPAQSPIDADVLLTGVKSFSAIRGSISRSHTIALPNDQNRPEPSTARLSGDQSGYFSILTELPKKNDPVKPGQALEIEIVFSPPAEFIGIATANIEFISAQKTIAQHALHGLSTKGLEGKNEPALTDVLTTLRLTTDVGWKTLANHIKPDLQGEEMKPTLFTKSGQGNVEMIPLARYSPSFGLPFGFYTDDGVTHQVGVLSAAKAPIPEHQTLYPAVAEGGTTFDPGDQPFGIYTTSPTHVAFSQDKLNRAANGNRKKRHAVHACRTYPVRNADGELMPNEFLFCFEEAGNGDYQDYVFLVKNVRPVIDNQPLPQPPVD